MKSINDLPDILQKDLQRNWEAFKDSSQKAGIELSQDSQILDALQRVLALSNFVADNCIRNPVLISDLIDGGDLQRRYGSKDYDQKLKTVLSDIADEQTLSRCLRNFRRREMLRIAFRDLCGWSDLTETVSDLSTMADTCLAQTTAILTRWLSNRYGVPTAEDGSRQDMVVLGLGKLGAGELNFSSDIDLIFTYPKAGRTTGSAQSMSNDDFFTRLGRQLIKAISQPTDDGFVFRTDLRLRPYGENGPLVMHFDALEYYY
ncbi:MAG: bifunctional [glutamate--ammonia ligase]-adenylyl-L-tyrosine phosphorylase/[glutamate--ammonia-ligase] adenylyltransferase, partial [Desulfobacterales bacterium]